MESRRREFRCSIGIISLTAIILSLMILDTYFTDQSRHKIKLRRPLYAPAREFSSSRTNYSFQLTRAIITSPHPTPTLHEIIKTEVDDSISFNSALSTHISNYLPNYFLHGRGEGRAEEYSSGNVVFVHNPKSGGTTMKKLLKRLAVNEGYTNYLIGGNANPDKVCRQLTTSRGPSNRRSIVFGDATFGHCDTLQGRPCSYFTIVRDPIERIISLFYYCQTPICKSLNTNKISIIDLARGQGSIFFKSLLARSGSCVRPLDRITAFADRIKTARKWGNGTENAQLAIERRAILNYFLDNLENWFAVIGITEQFNSTLKALETVYKFHFNKAQTSSPQNVGTVKSHSRESGIAAMRSQLENSPVVKDALYEDSMLYAKAKEIFEKQKNSLLMR